MLIPFQEVLNIHRLKPKGILHVGAHHGEELSDYLNAGVENIVWVEALPDKVAYLKGRHEIYQKPATMKVLQACVSDVTGESVEFNITNNGQSSSMLNLKEHLVQHPEVHVVNTIRLTTITLSDLMRQNGLDTGNYDFVNLDIQGAELKALRGMGDLLDKVNCIYCEVNIRELYAGCPPMLEIDHFLKLHEFDRYDTKFTRCYWGDALYLRSPE